MSKQAAGERKRDLTKRQQFAEKGLRKIDKAKPEELREELLKEELREKAKLEGDRATFRNLMGWPFVFIPAAAIILGSDVHSLFTLVLIVVFAFCHVYMVWMGGQEALISPDNKRPLWMLTGILLVIYLFLGLPALMDLVGCDLI